MKILNLSANRADIKTMRLLSELFRPGTSEFKPMLEEIDLSESPLSTDACFALASGLS